MKIEPNIYQLVITIASALRLLGITGCSSVQPTAASSNVAGSIDDVGPASSDRSIDTAPAGYP